MITEKLVKVALIFMVLVLVLTACGQGGSSSGAPSSTGSTASKASSTAPAPAESPKIANFNETGYPICPDKTVTLRVMINTRPEMPADLNSLALVQKREEITNVHVDWLMVPGTGWEEKKNLMLATGDLPDVIESQVSASDLTKYGPEGTFIPMQDLIAKYATNFTALYDEMPGMESYITAPDGNIYGICRINAGPWMPVNGNGIINKGWLDNLGLPLPKNTDDFYEAMKAFKTGDPNGNGIADEIPMSFAGTLKPSGFSSSYGINHLLYSFGFALGGSPFNETYADIRDGKVINIGTLPEFKEAISFLSKLYAEGLLDPECFTLTEADLRAKLNAEPGIIGYSQVWDINDVVSNVANNEDFVYMDYIDGPGGRKAVSYRQPLPGTYRGWGVITKACATPEVAIRWIDYIFDETNSIEEVEGPIGVRVLEKGDGTLYVRNPPEGISVAEDRFANCKAGLIGMVESRYRNRLKLPSTDEKVAFLDANLDKFADPDPFPPVYYSAEESVDMLQLQTDMVQYIERRASEWIMNGKIDAEWDAYLQEIEKVGLSKWLSIKQAAYDRYISN